MIEARPVDCGAIYEEERRAFVKFLRSCDAPELATSVPATPEWSVRDVLAHVVGVTADLNAENFGDSSDPDAWTAAQVRARRDRTVDELAAEWDGEAPRFEDGLRLFGYEIGSHYIGDLLQHVADVKHALGRPRPSDNLTLAVALDFYLISFEQSLDEQQCGAVQLGAGEESWTLGSGAAIASVTAERFELFRSLGGRRSEAQVRALSWRGDMDAVVPIFSRYPLPEADIIDHT